MKLLTKELTEKLNRAGYAGTKPICKLFTPWGRATWLITGMEDGILYGWAQLFPDVNPEWGGIASLEELEAIRGPFNLKIERDLYWTPPEKEVNYYQMEVLG